MSLTDGELATLFTRAQSGDKEAMTDALSALERLLYSICRWYRERATAALDWDDILQEARFAAFRAIHGYQPGEVPPGAYVALRVRNAVRRKLGLRRADRHEVHSFSLDARVGDTRDQFYDLYDPALVDEMSSEDQEIMDLLARVPKGVVARKGDRLAYILPARQLNDRLPDDDTLVTLIKAGKSLAELAQMLGAKPRAIQHRLKTIRKGGVAVPPVFHQRAPKTGLPREGNLRQVADYFRAHPAALNREAAKDLGICENTVAKARRALRRGDYYERTSDHGRGVTEDLNRAY